MARAADSPECDSGAKNVYDCIDRPPAALRRPLIVVIGPRSATLWFQFQLQRAVLHSRYRPQTARKIESNTQRANDRPADYPASGAANTQYHQYGHLATPCKQGLLVEPSPIKVRLTLLIA